MDNDLLRQRRNLMLVSTGLLLFDFADVSIAKVSVLGTELLVGNATVLVYFAWAVWGYFLIRYYQYLSEHGDLGILVSIKSFFEGKAREYVFRFLDKKTTGKITLKQFGLEWRYSVVEYDIQQSAHVEIKTGGLPPLRVIYWFILSGLFVVTRTPKVTDHIFPFILAASAPLVTLFY